MYWPQDLETAELPLGFSRDQGTVVVKELLESLPYNLGLWWSPSFSLPSWEYHWKTEELWLHANLMESIPFLHLTFWEKVKEDVRAYSCGAAGLQCTSANHSAITLPSHHTASHSSEGLRLQGAQSLSSATGSEEVRTRSFLPDHNILWPCAHAHCSL